MLTPRDQQSSKRHRSRSQSSRRLLVLAPRLEAPTGHPRVDTAQAGPRVELFPSAGNTYDPKTPGQKLSKSEYRGGVYVPPIWQNRPCLDLRPWGVVSTLRGPR
jgi:hypothetical protein